MDREIILMGLIIHITSHKMPHPMWSYHGLRLVSNNTFYRPKQHDTVKRWGLWQAVRLQAGTYRLCRAHALHVSCARRASDSRHFILKIKLNWRHSNLSISSSLLRESKGMKIWITSFFWSTVSFRTHTGPASRPVSIWDTRRAILNQKNGW